MSDTPSTQNNPPAPTVTPPPKADDAVAKAIQDALLDVSQKKVGDTPKERFDLANKGYVDKRVGSLIMVDSATAVVVAEGTFGLPMPATFNGLNLTAATATVYRKGITGSTTLQIRRARGGVDVDMLSTAISIGDAYFASNGVVDTTNDDILTGDIVFVDVDTVHSGTAPKGLSVALTFN